VLFVGSAAVLWFRTEPLPRVQLDANREIQVAHVAVGKDHAFSWEAPWKRLLRPFFPGAQFFGPELRDTFSLKHDSLVVWMRIPGLTNPTGWPSSTRHGFAALPDGSLVPGTWTSRQGTGLRWTFRCFARGEKRIPLRFHFGSNVVNLTVQNPRPVSPARWSARSMPQTNYAPGTQIVLERFGLPVVRLRAVPEENAERGWVFWNVAAFDPWGNWVTATGGDYSLTISDGLSLAERVWRIEASGTEYVPAAFVDVPQPGECIQVPLSARAKQLGMRFLLWAGPGEYRISPGFNVVCDNAPAQRGEWKFSCAAPTALCISDQLPSEVRLRERVRPGGRVFRNERGLAGVSGPAPMQVFTPRFRGPTTNLQLELVVTLPTAEFFVNAPESMGKGRKTIHDPF
jgi:hypothetical protein